MTEGHRAHEFSEFVQKYVNATKGYVNPGWEMPRAYRFEGATLKPAWGVLPQWTLLGIMTPLGL